MSLAIRAPWELAGWAATAGAAQYGLGSACSRRMRRHPGSRDFAGAVQMKEILRRPFAGPMLFFMLVFCWTWAFWIPAAASGISVQTSLGRLLLVLGLLGPMLGGIGFTYGTPDGRRLERLLAARVRRRPHSGQMVCNYSVVCAGALHHRGAARSSLRRKRCSGANQQDAHIILLRPVDDRSFSARHTDQRPDSRGVGLARICARPLAGTLGRRGREHRSRCALGDMASSAVLFEGMKHNVGIRSLWFWLFVLQTIPVTIIFTWIFNNTSRSTLGAILFHFMTNLTAELTNRMDGTNLYSTALWSLAAVAVVACQGVGTSIRGEHG
ncbi:hypothetical protein ABIA44_001019 [Bradyrhizobium sp. USDA 329]